MQPFRSSLRPILLGNRCAAMQARPSKELRLMPHLVSSRSFRCAGISVLALGMALMLPAALLVAMGVRKFGRKRGPVWDCGLPGLSEENEYTATAFSKALRMIFSVLYKPRREIQAVFDVSPYFPKEIRFESEIEPTFEKRLYAPLQEFIFRVSRRMRTIQAGSIHAYLAYIFVTLVLLLLFGVRK